MIGYRVYTLFVSALALAFAAFSLALVALTVDPLIGLFVGLLVGGLILIAADLVYLRMSLHKTGKAQFYHGPPKWWQHRYWFPTTGGWNWIFGTIYSAIGKAVQGCESSTEAIAACESAFGIKKMSAPAMLSLALPATIPPLQPSPIAG